MQQNCAVKLHVNPFNILAVGMWLSFGGTLGIVLFHKFLLRYFECKFKIKSKFIINFLSIFLVSFSAQIMILPIMIYCFNTVSLTFFISNLLIYFLIGPLLSLGYISLILGTIIPKIRNFYCYFWKFFSQNFIQNCWIVFKITIFENIFSNSRFFDCNFILHFSFEYYFFISQEKNKFFKIYIRWWIKSFF